MYDRNVTLAGLAVAAHSGGARIGVHSRGPDKRARSVMEVSARGETAHIRLYGVVGGDWNGDGITHDRFAAEMDKLKDVKRLDIRLNSPGGDVHQGRAIYNLLRAHGARKVVHVDSEASSIASIIAMAGNEIRMGEGAVMLIHRCYCLNIGNSVELQKLAKDLNTLDETFVATYAARTGMAPAKIFGLMDENRYMSAEEAKKLKFADFVEEPVSAAACDIDRGKFGLPELPAALQPRRIAAIAETESLRRLIFR